MENNIASHISHAVSAFESGSYKLMNDAALRAVLDPAVTNMFFPVRTLHHDYYMTRIRINNGGRSFKPWEMSYKPQVFNTTYQRASTPNKTMFYASSCERRDDFGRPFTDFEFGIIMAFLETIPELRNECEVEYGGKSVFPIIRALRDFNYSVTASTWKVIRDIELPQISPANFYDYEYSNFQMVKVLYDDYFNTFPDQRESTLDLIKILSREFSKIVTNDSQYRISAITSEIVVGRGYDGVCFPSTRGDGAGINFAILPRCIDSGAIDYVGKVELTVSSSNKELSIR